jgi:hypothetical protein
MLSGSIELKPIEPEELIAKFKAMTEETWQSIRDELLHRLAPEEALELFPV